MSASKMSIAGFAKLTYRENLTTFKKNCEYIYLYTYKAGTHALSRVNNLQCAADVF